MIGRSRTRMPVAWYTAFAIAAAVVAPEAVQYGLARMWQIRLESIPWRATVVTSLNEAL